MQVFIIVLIFISFNEWTINEFLAPGVSGYVMHQFEYAYVKRQMTSLPLDSRENYDLSASGPGSGGVDRKSWVVQRRRAPQSGCSSLIFLLKHR